MPSSSKNDSDLNRPKPQANADWMRVLDSSATQIAKPGGTKATSAQAPLPDVAGYQVLEEWGWGDTGRMYKARHLERDRLVILALIPDSPPRFTHRLERFKSEYERLHHPNILQLDEAVVLNGQLIVTFEHVEGRFLKQWLRRTPPSVNQAAAFLEGLARAVQHAHEQGIVHGHLAPGNIVLAIGASSDRPRSDAMPGSLPIGEPPSTADALLTIPKIADFGLAILFAGPEDFAHGGAQDAATRLEYQAPEQTHAMAAGAEPAADVYALGVILYEMLTGRPPFTRATETEMRLLIQSQPPVPPRLFRPWLPSSLETICLTCLHKNPARRYRSAAALADELVRFLNGQSIKAWPPGWFGRTLRWTAVAALIVSTAIFGIWAACK